jgi:hypothetical protein
MPILKVNCSAVRIFTVATLLAGAVNLFCPGVTPAAHAQVTSGNIAGVVKDATGAAIANASVVVKSESTGVAVNVKANSSGEYLVQNLLPGRYDVTATSAGFAASTLMAVPVTLNSTATADVSLAAGQQSSTVEVNADAGITLDTTSQNLTTSFTNEELSTLPTAAIGGAGQSGVLNASLLSPGVASSGGLGIGVGPSIGGQRPRNNNFTIEGIDNNNKAVTGPLVYTPNDAVGQFSLITNQFSPEFGHSAGGQFNTNIVSGTNKFHGRLYEYFQNKNLNAAEGVAGGKVPNQRYDNNRYGAQLGGPILRDKLFFFGNYERNTVGRTVPYYLCTPTAGGLATLRANAAAFSANNLAQYLQYTPAATVTGAGGAAIDASADVACGNSGSGPQQLVVTNAAGASVNVDLGNYLVKANSPISFYSITTGVDYNISQKDSLRLRYIYNNENEADTAANLPVFFTNEPFKYHLFALSEYHTFTPNLVNEFRLGFNRFENITGAGNFSFPGLDQFPNLQFYDQGFISIGPDGNAPQFTYQNLYQATDNISYTVGKHTLKIGFDGRKYISPQGFTQRARGDYEWSNLNDYLHDLAPDSNGFGERSTGNGTYYGDQTALYGYANDTWRASSTITVNAGIRYEFTSVPTGERTQALNSVANVPGLINFHAPQPTYTAWAPRVGVEWAPDAKTSVRAGFGLAYDVLFDNLGTLSFPPQLSQTQDVGSGAPCANGKICPGYSSANFLANGGLPPATGSVVKVLSRADALAETSAFLPDQVLPYSENYTLTIQREVAKGLNAEIGYIGTRGIHLPTQIQLNVQSPVTKANQLGTTAGTTTLVPATGNTLGNLDALSYFIPAYSAAGFGSKITSYQPWSGSNYNGLIANLTGRVHGLQLNLSYTFSRTMDNATDEVFATVLTPRRPEDSQNLNQDYSRSALDRTHRVSLEADYNFVAFKNRNYVLRSIVSNWVIAPIYTYESPEYATALSGVNSNLNGDSGAAIDRPLINPSGVKGTGTGVVPVVNPAFVGRCDPTATSGPTAISSPFAANGTFNVCDADTTGYSAGTLTPNATNTAATFTPSNAYYVQAGPGVLPNASRNTLPIRPINNFDVSLLKRLQITERYQFEFGAQAFNVLNHAQYIPGSVDNVNGPSYVNSYNFQTVSNAFFNRPEKEFTNNPRTMQLSGKFIF